MQLNVQVISGILTTAVVVLTILGVLKNRKSSNQKPTTARKEPTVTTTVEETINEATTEEEPLVIVDETPQQPTVPLENAPVLTITLLAEKERPYAGYELLQALLSNGLRFGEMNIFHFKDSSTGTNKSLFSCASAKNPGTFDIKNMGPFSTPGLTFFLQLDPEMENATSLDAMLSTADIIVHDLGGRLLDNNHSPLTDEGIANYQKTIRAFEQRVKETA